MREPDWEIIAGAFVPMDSEEPPRAGPERSAPESLFALSNGYLGVRGANEEGGDHGTFVNGYFERTPIDYGETAFGYARFHETIVNVPDATNFEFELDGRVLGRDGRVVSEGRRLDLRRGVLERSSVWELPDGRVVRFFSERFVSLARPTLTAFRVRCRLEGCLGRVELRTRLNTRPANAEAGDDPRVGAKFREPPYRVETARAEGRRADVRVRTRSSGLELGVASVSAAIRLPAGQKDRTVPDGTRGKANGTELPPESHTEGTSEFPVLKNSFRTELADGESIVFTKRTCYRRDAACGAAWTEGGAEASRIRGLDSGAFEDRVGLESLARSDAEAASDTEFDELLMEHSRVLEEFWDSCGLSLEGPKGLEAAIRFNLFHIFQAAGRDGFTNVPAKGLTGEGYEGHYFWDTEIYLLPLLTYTAPKIARALLEYRAAIMDKARDRAREMGHTRGALFPWRTISGRETSAYYPAGTAQYHIDADIAYAVGRYVRATADREFLRTQGTEILVETARLWTDVGHWGRDGKFRIDEVTGPDEYSALVNNNAYTNVMARANLRAAARAVRELAKDAPEARARLDDALGLFQEEPGSWETAADGMYIPYDEIEGIIPQDDSFMSREPWDFEHTPAEKHPLLLHFHPLIIYRKRVLKQPDLLLAMVLRPSEFGAAEKKRNFDYYEPLTTGDSSLSHCAMSIAAAEAGYPERAWDYFLRTVRLDLDDAQGNSAHGVHIAAMGGSWSSLIYGFAGFRDDRDEYAFFPTLPPALSGLSFRLSLLGGRLSISLTKERAEYRWEGSVPLSLRHEYERFELRDGDAKSFDLRPSFRAAVFDLDGVLADTAVLHTRAWKRLAEEEGLPVPQELHDRVKGISRMKSLELVLGDRSSEFSPSEKEGLAERKNAYYRELVASLTPSDALPGARELLEILHSRGVKIALASASRNAAEVLERLDMAGYFDAVGDAAKARPKPDPEIFLTAAETLGIPPRDCVGVEDAQAGVDAIRSAGMKSLGVGTRLSGADLVTPGLERLTYEDFRRLFAPG